jgi:hypothetical protein
VNAAARPALSPRSQASTICAITARRAASSAPRGEDASAAVRGLTLAIQSTSITDPPRPRKRHDLPRIMDLQAAFFAPAVLSKMVDRPQSVNYR